MTGADFTRTCEGCEHVVSLIDGLIWVGQARIQ